MIKHPNKLGFNELVAEYTVTGSAATTITFDGLDINADGGWTIVSSLVSAGIASTADVYMYVAGDTSNANYISRYISSSSTTLVTNSQSTPAICAIYSTSGYLTYAVTECSRVNGYTVYNSSAANYNTTGANINFVKHNVSKTNITRLDFTCATASGLAVGSKIQIYRWKPAGSIKTLSALSSSPLVWSYEVTGSAVSSVTAAGLDIVRDGSYKVVVAHVAAIASTGVGIACYCDDGAGTLDTTVTNYTTREIESAASSVTTVSYNSCAVGYASSYTTLGQITYSVSDISLVNQKVCINTSYSSTDVRNAYLSFIYKSTASTNITKLQFTGSVSSAIGVGSKFYIFRTR